MSKVENSQKAGADASAFFAATERDDPPVYERVIRPNNSLPIKGFVTVIALTAWLFLIPLMAFLGTPVLWVLLGAIGITLAGLWYALQRNYQDRSVTETLRIWPDLIAVHRANPRDQDQYWHANPYWVTTAMKDTKALEAYLTLKGGAREIELGAFLSVEERVALRHDLDRQLARLDRR